MKKGIVYLVGAGPGDPGLLSRRADDLLAAADVVVYDYLVSESLLNSCREDCERIYVGKQPGFHAKPQEEIEDILSARAGAGNTVVRLKGGDPFVFGRGGEEIRRLTEDGIPFEVVPGVTAALAAAAYAGIPLTHRECSSTVTFLTGHEDPEKSRMRVNFRDFGRIGGTLCIYMGMGHLRFITDELMAGGLAPETPAAVVQWATLPKQRSVSATLGQIAEAVEGAGMGAPAIIFVGDTVAESRGPGWFQDRPLFGRRIVVTRNPSQARALTERLEARGAEVLEMPLVQVQHSADSEIVDDVFAEIGSYEWLIFSSVNGVKGFFDLFFRKFEDIRSLGFLRIAAVGSATATAVEEHRLKVDLVPVNADGESLVEALLNQQTMDNSKVLVVTGNLGRGIIEERLEEAQAIVDVMPVYRTERTDLGTHPSASVFRRSGADAITFTSPSAVRSFVAQAGSLQPESGARTPITCSIGPVTSAAMREAGMPVDVEASQQSLDGIVKALVNTFTNESTGRS